MGGVLICFCFHVVAYVSVICASCWDLYSIILKCNMFYRIMNDVRTRTVVCCYRGRVRTDLSVL